MKISEQWLREWINPTADIASIGESLTLGGLEVEAISPVAPLLEGVVVAEVLELERHPKAEQLSICSVFDGKRKLQVVCGAPNVSQGMKVAYAELGTELPDGRTIENTNIRGIESEGMLCSDEELGIGEDASGVLELPSVTKVGLSISEALNLDDSILEIDLTPNRGDCFSVLGIARDLGALIGSCITPPQIPSVSATNNQSFGVELEKVSDCPRYVSRVISDTDSRTRTPLWMRERLRRMGIRCVHPIVDITNYVMLELGQPLHAFDLKKLDRRIIVRAATPNERLVLIDGKNIELDPETLVIADNSGAVALAGIMGGEDTAVSGETKNVFLESAFFEPVPLAGTARRYHLQTDASTRFERGVDPSMQARAIERATSLILEICGGDAGPCQITGPGSNSPKRRSVPFRPQSVQRLLGMPVTEKRIEEIFEALEIQVRHKGEEWLVTPPAFRFDISIEADLVEEVARVIGYENIPSSLPLGEGKPARAVKELALEDSLRGCLITRGYFEVVTYSFIDPKLSEQLNPQRAGPKLANPISSEMSLMRPSLWPGLVSAAQYNLNRQQNDIRLFEIGMIFILGPTGLAQTNRVAGVRHGPAVHEQWGENSREADFYDFKQDVMSIARSLRIDSVGVEATEIPGLHPNCGARLVRNGAEIGQIGALHPATARALGINKSLYLFEMDYKPGSAANLAQYVPISKFPAVRRDISVIVDESVPFSDCLAAVREGAGKALRDLELFDVYRGQGIDSDKKSLSLGLIFQTISSTLVDSEVDEAVSRAVENLARRVGGSLRE